MKLVSLLPLCTVAVLSVPAWAQTPPPVVSKIPCVQPEQYPGHLATDLNKKAWQKTMDTYGVCIKKYIDDQRATVDLATKAANAAVAEYNDVATKAKTEIEKNNE